MRDKRRFLITTPDERTWRLGQPVLFLGHWCRLNSRRSLWERLDSEVVPEYVWSEGQKDAEFEYVLRLREQLLVELMEALNLYHHSNHSLRYWRILLDPWLSTFVTIIYDRWATVRLALEEYEVEETVVLDIPASQTTPRSLADFLGLYRSDVWNHGIFGRILGQWFDVRCERIASQESYQDKPVPVAIQKSTLKSRLRRITLQAMRAVSSRLSRPTDAFFLSSYLLLRYDFILQLQLGQIPKYWTMLTPPVVAPDPQARQKLSLALTRHKGFEQCIRTLIPEQIPSLYLEGYQELKKAAAEVPWPQRPKVIFTANNYFVDEVFKAWVAEKTEQGVPYVIGQHGGNYGIGKYPAQSEINEGLTADRHLTWGWTDKNPQRYPCVALKIVGMPTGTWNPAGGLLQVTTVELRYNNDPWEGGCARAGYIEDQFRFASALPHYIRAELTVRLHAAHASHGNPQDVLWQSRHPDVRLDLGTEPIEPLIRKCRLFVYTYNSTGFLETLGRNIPTLIFWDPKYNELRPSAEPYFDLLKHAGIFHESAESAAAKATQVWNSVGAWWNLRQVQDARLRFCDRYARLPESPIQALKEALTTVKRRNS